MPELSTFSERILITMCKIVSGGYSTGVTMLSNLFIDKFMPEASETNLKVYLYILRYIYVPEADISLTSIADVLDLTPRSVVKALKYWQNCGILTFQTDESGEIKRIFLNDISSLSTVNSSQKSSVVSADTMPAVDVSSAVSAKFSVPVLSPTDINRISEQNRFRQLFEIVENYLAPATATPDDINALAVIIDSLNFSDDLTLHLYDYCSSKNKLTSSYILKVATNWAEKNIRTVEDAKLEEQFYDDLLISIKKSLGMTRNLGKVQFETIEKWRYTYHMPEEMILEACNRACMQEVEKPFSYAAKTIKNWYDDGIKTMDELAKADLRHENEVAAKAAARKNASVKKETSYNQFNDFEQRTITPEDDAKFGRYLLSQGATKERRDAFKDRLAKAADSVINQ